VRVKNKYGSWKPPVLLPRPQVVQIDDSYYLLDDIRPLNLHVQRFYFLFCPRQKLRDPEMLEAVYYLDQCGYTTLSELMEELESLPFPEIPLKILMIKWGYIGPNAVRKIKLRWRQPCPYTKQGYKLPLRYYVL
jgi:hypothetical protein